MSEWNGRQREIREQTKSGRPVEQPGHLGLDQSVDAFMVEFSSDCGLAVRDEAFD